MADKMIPSAALDYIKQKKLKPAFSYKDVWNEEHAAAFTVAKAMQIDVLSDIKTAVEKAIESGQDYGQFKKELEPLLMSKGWWGKKSMADPLTGETISAQLGSDRRLKTIYRTNLRSAYQKGQYDRTMASDAHPYLMYCIGPSTHHREDHAGWNGLILKKDDPWWNTHFPPNGWGCKCYTRAVTKERKERYEKDGIPVAKMADGTGGGTITVKTVAPRTTYKVYSNPRKGTLERVPDGVTPGFAWNMSIPRDKQVEREVGDKIKYAQEAVKTKTAKKIVTQKIVLPETFTPAESIKQANEYAEKTLGVLHADYKGCDVVSANEWNKGLFDSFKQFPELRKKVKFTGECRARSKAIKPVYLKEEKARIFNILKQKLPKYDDKVLLEAAEKQAQNHFKRQFSVSKLTFANSFETSNYLQEFSGIAVNADYAKNSSSFIEDLKTMVRIKFHPEGTDTIRSVLDHEIGHQLDSMLDISNQADIIKLYSVTNEEITNGLSTYAWKNSNSSKINEFVAEGWSEYCNNPNPRPMAKTIGETILRRYSEWKKNL